MEIEDLKDIMLSEELKKKFITLFSMYNSGNVLYTSILKRRLMISNETVSLLNEFLISKKLVEEIHYLVCLRCSNHTVYKDEIEELSCQYCDELLDSKYKSVAYRIIK